MSDDGLDEYRAKEYIKRNIRRTEREEAQERRDRERQAKAWDKKEESEKRGTLDRERQQLRASINSSEFDRRNGIKKAEKDKDREIKNYQSDTQRANHGDTLQHTRELSEQEFNQLSTLEKKRHLREIEILNGKLKAEQFFNQERYKAELELQQDRDQSELARAEMLAEWDYNEQLDTQREITGREISLAKEITSRELALARENNQHLIIIEKEKHLIILEQKAQELEHYQARVSADSQALTLKEDQALERRLTESRHNFGQDVQKLHGEFLRMKLENKMKKELFTHEQETLLRMRKLAKDLGLDYENLSTSELSDLIGEFENNFDKE